MTEEGKVKYLHPKASINNDSEQVLFARYITNIVYDMYVDALISTKTSTPIEYFLNKITIYETYLNNVKRHLNFTETLTKVMKVCIHEYIEVLNLIICHNISDSAYIRDNSIMTQREHINKYIKYAGLSYEFEWLDIDNSFYTNEMSCSGS